MLRLPLAGWLGLALATLAPLGSAQIAPACVGDVLISEFHHPNQLVTGPGPVAPVPYIELMNRRLAGPPQGLGVGGLVLTLQWPGGSSSFTLPPGTAIPEPRLDPIANRLRPGTLVIAPPGPLPNLPAQSPLGISYVFTLPAAQTLFDPMAGAPGSGLRITIQRAPNTIHPQGIFDQLIVGQDPGTSPPSFGVFGPPVPSTGHVNRVTYIHNCQGYNYESSTGGNSPGRPDPNLDHVGGFRFGSTAAGVPLTFTAMGPTGNQVSAPFFGNAVVLQGLLFPRHPEWPEINDPAFDRALQTWLVSFSATSPLLANDERLSGATIQGGLNWSLTVAPTSSTAQPGVLQINSSGPINDVPGAASFSLVSGAPDPLRVERLLADSGLVDGTTTGAGDLSEAQEDIVRAEDGGPDLWCEMIVYDGGGNAYRVKVRNWPSSPSNCTGPRLGTGTDGSSSATLVAFCFSPNTELYLLPSLNVATPTGSGSTFGLNPDALTSSALAQPLPTPPFHVTTDGDGLYWFSAPSTGLPPGTSIDWLAVGLPAGLAPEIAPVANLTL